MTTLRRIHPDHAELTVEAAFTGLDLAAQAPAERPYVIANMVSSLDGRAAVAGRSGALGGAADRAVFHELRGQVDAVLVGSRTMRTESYGALVRDDERRERRRAAGLEPMPIGAVVTRSLDLALDIPLFQDPESTIVVFTSGDAELPPRPADVRVTRIPARELTMAAALRRLRADHGVRSVLCEGGPTVLGALVAEGVLDELFLTASPLLVGGDAPHVLEASSIGDPVRLDLVWALEAEGALFLRYAVRR